MKQLKFKKTKLAMISAALATVLLFQNCGAKYDLGLKASEKASTVATTVANPAACVDDKGASHEPGVPWKVIIKDLEKEICYDKSEIEKHFELSTTFLCNDAKIITDEVVKTYEVNQKACPEPPTGCGSNCPVPKLVVSVDQSNPKEGLPNHLNIETIHVDEVKYTCSLKGTKEVIAAAVVDVGIQKIPITFTGDAVCKVTAVPSNGPTLEASVDVTVDCDGRIKDEDTLTCRDYECKGPVQLLAMPATGEKLVIPARDATGSCYAVKLMNEIPLSPAKLTKNRDASVESRDHDDKTLMPDGSLIYDPAKVSNPYLMGQSTLDFETISARRVKLSGSLDNTPPQPGQVAANAILVDNFVLVGIYPAGLPQPPTPNYYRAYGTSDSSITKAGGNSVLLENTALEIQAFGDFGTSTIDALDVTTNVNAATPYTIDIRALDCGDQRQLSNIYLLFQ